MKRTNVTLASAVLAATLAASGAAAQAGGSGAHASRAATVSLRHTALGKILVSGSGRTLYEFSRDHANRNTCATISECPATWPALKATSRPTAGSGVRASLLSTIRLPHGGSQVTYAGHPLYLYAGDSGPGETTYVGERAFGGNWYAINAAGQTVR